MPDLRGLVATDPGDYMGKAVALGNDLVRRERLRERLGRMAAGQEGIWDTVGLAAELEETLAARPRPGSRQVP